jgi:hypothetical protein
VISERLAFACRRVAELTEAEQRGDAPDVAEMAFALDELVDALAELCAAALFDDGVAA